MALPPTVVAAARPALACKLLWLHVLLQREAAVSMLISGRADGGIVAESEFEVGEGD